jgi:hypothetical protein
LFIGDLVKVSMIPDSTGSQVCERLPADRLDWSNADIRRRHNIETAAINLAGKAATPLFCLCSICKTEDEAIERMGPRDEEGEQVRRWTAPLPDEVKIAFHSAVIAALQRHRPQLDAIVETLLKYKTLSGAQVFEVMRASGWKPETDPDPEQFFSEFLGCSKEELPMVLRNSGCETRPA